MSDNWKEREKRAKERERLIRKFYGADFVGDIGALRIIRKITKQEIRYHSFMVQNAPGRHRARGVSFVSDFQDIPFVKGGFKGLKKSKVYRVSDVESFANGYISHRGKYKGTVAKRLNFTEAERKRDEDFYRNLIKELGHFLGRIGPRCGIVPRYEEAGKMVVDKESVEVVKTLEKYEAKVRRGERSITRARVIETIKSVVNVAVFCDDIISELPAFWKETAKDLIDDDGLAEDWADL